MKLLPAFPSWLKRRVPAFDWLAHYKRKHLPGDALAGVIVATLLIPQGMAYALLAGLPPQLARAVPQTHVPTLTIGVGNILLLLVFQYVLPRVFASWKKLPSIVAQSLSTSGPLFAVIVGTAIVAAFGLGETSGVNIVGEIPRGLPKRAFPALGGSEFLPLIPLALTVSFVGFLESISVAKTLASKRRQKVESNQELIALGAANVAAGVTGAYPVQETHHSSLEHRQPSAAHHPAGGLWLPSNPLQPRPRRREASSAALAGLEAAAGLVIGAAPVGLFLAKLLGRVGMTTLLLEKRLAVAETSPSMAIGIMPPSRFRARGALLQS